MAFPHARDFVLTHDPRYENGRISPPQGHGPPHQLPFGADFLNYWKPGPAPATELYINSRTHATVTLYHGWLLAAFSDTLAFRPVGDDVVSTTGDRLIMLSVGNLYSGGWVDRLFLVGPLFHRDGLMAATGAWLFEPQPLA